MSQKITDAQIIRFFFRHTKGIKGVAAHFGLPKSYIGKIISQYIKKIIFSTNSLKGSFLFFFTYFISTPLKIFT